MSITVKLKDHDEVAIGLIKTKHHISTKTKVLLFCLHDHEKLEHEIAELQRERSELLIKLANYREHSLELLSGISGLQKLSNL